MKKLFNLLLISLLTILLIPNVYAKDEVSIESINLVENSEKTSEISKPTINGLKIGFDLSFSDLGDYAKYEVVVNNSTNKEYEIKDETTFSSSNYIEYKYEFKEKTNRIKANSKATLYITIMYKNPVPADKLTDGKYIENNEMAISLSNEDNPKTFNNYIYLFLILVSLIVISLLIRNKNIKSLSIIVIALLLVPTTIFALEKLKLDVSTKITIEKKYMVTFGTHEIIKASEASNYNLIETIQGRLSITKPETKAAPVSRKIFIDDEEYLDLFIVKDIAYYREGDIVNVKKYKIQTIDNLDNCTLVETSDIIAQPYDKLVCQKSELISTEVRFGIYEAANNPNAQPNDNIIMNFKNKEYDYDTWVTSKPIIEFRLPDTFNMPKHDVFIELARGIAN